MHPTVKIAIKAAHQAGDIIMKYHNQIDALTINDKNAFEFVSDVDKIVEETIIEEISKYFPTHSFLGEESDNTDDDNDYVWVIDPLNGTTNYLHGFPQYAISIALFEKDVLTHSVVYDPFKNEVFYASKGKGAFIESDKDNKRIRVTDTVDFDKTIIGTGFPFKLPQHLDTYLNIFKAIHPKTSGIRRAGSAALDLAYIAAGRLDGFWEIGLNKWDIAAGVLLIQEAGGFVGDFSGRGAYFTTGNVVAGNKYIFKEILKTIHPHLTKELQY